mgnify:CR=1 FL=1
MFRVAQAVDADQLLFGSRPVKVVDLIDQILDQTLANDFFGELVYEARHLARRVLVQQPRFALSRQQQQLEHIEQLLLGVIVQEDGRLTPIQSVKVLDLLL